MRSHLRTAEVWVSGLKILSYEHSIPLTGLKKQPLGVDTLNKPNSIKQNGRVIVEEIFRLDAKMVEDIIDCLFEYKSTMENKGLHFDGDKPMQKLTSLLT